MLEKKPNTDGTIGKAFVILDIVESFHSPVKFNDILANSPFPKPSTYRLLRSLVSQDMLSIDADGYYALGSRLIRLAHSAWKNASIAPIAAQFIDELSVHTGETIHLAKLDNGQVLYLDKRNSSKPIRMFSDAGKVGPVYCTGVGKAMLAFSDEITQKTIIAQQSYYKHTENSHTSEDSLLEELKKIKHEGVAYDRQEHEPNIICIAVPILAPNEQVLGGMSITSSTNISSLEKLADYETELKKTAQLIGEQAAIWLLPKMGG